jgi:hypothetical protein
MLATWPELQRAFRKAQGAASGDRLYEVAIVNALCEGSMELLAAVEDEKVVGGLILQFVRRPKGMCCIVVVSLFNTFHRGDIPHWVRLMNEHLIDYAMKTRGCYCIEAFARDAVVRGLEQMGWRRKATVMEIR